MPSRAALCLAVLLATAPLVAATIPCTTGRPLAGIVTAGQAPHETYLAAETQRVLRGITGIDLPAVALGKENRQAGRWLYIGCAPDLAPYRADLAKVGDEGIILDATPQAVVCLGNTPRGTYYAVQELYYRLGCRWYTPFPGGECLPHAERLALPRGRLVHRPSFDLRGAKTIQVYHYPPTMQWRHVDAGQWVDWAARNRMNGLKASYPWTWEYGLERGGEWAEWSGHSLSHILPAEKCFKEHPEYYPLVRGKRVSAHSSGRPTQLCTTNPEVIRLVAEHIISFFDKTPNARRFGLCAEDEPNYWCECPACRALDTAKGNDWAKNGDTGFDLTDRWLTFVNEVARLVAAKHPDKIIATFAYASTTKLPRRVRPAPGVQIELTWWNRCFKHSITDPDCEINRRGMALFHQWRRLAPISIYGYLDYRYPEAPGPYLHADADFLRAMHRAGVRHISDEWDSTHLASPLLLNLRARLLWDVDTDVDRYLTDLCQAVYGPAAGPVAEYWRLLEDAVRKAATPHVTFNDLGKFTPAVLAQGHVLLSRAMTAAGPDQVLQARVARLRISLLYAEVCQLLEKTSADPAAWVRLVRLRDQVDYLAKRYDLPILLGAYTSLDTAYRPPMAALTGKRLLELPAQWLFRTDPKQEGEQAGWGNLADPAGWQPIGIGPWEEHGYPGYDGAAWYAQRVTLPAAAGRAWLLFEGVDETYRLWINGQEVPGSAKVDPGVVWDKPQATEITGRYRPGQENLVVVRVNDVGYAGGIYRPVWLVESK